MRIGKKTIIFLAIFFLFSFLLPVKANDNSLDIFYFNVDADIEDLSVSLYDMEETFLTVFEKEAYLLNEKDWFHFYLEDYTFSHTDYLIYIFNGNNEPIKYTLSNNNTIYYANDYVFSHNIDDLINEITYATFIDRKQIKFFTKFPVDITEISLLKNDTYLLEDDYSFIPFTNQYFINLEDDIDFNFEYYIELTSSDGLASRLSFVNYNEIYTTGFFETLFNYNGDDLGIKYNLNSTTFKVWAPTLNNLSLNLYNTDNVKTKHNMEKTDDGVFYYRSYLNLINYEYTFSFTRGKTEYEIIDPYVKYISPNNRGLIVDLNSFTPNSFKSWQPKTITNQANYVIYESSIKRLTGNLTSLNLNSNFNGLLNPNLIYTDINKNTVTTGLGHLKELGITHLTLSELIDTKHSLSIISKENSLKTEIGSEIVELKQLIKTLNDNGINVVLDLNTYNKVITSLETLMPGYYYETNKNEVITTNEKAFFETNHYMTNKYLESQVSYLVNEFKFKGLKLNPLNSFNINYLNNEIREMTQDESFVVYGEFIDSSPNNLENKLSSAANLDQVKHVGFIDEERFMLDENFINSASNNSLKGYILSSWSNNYNTLNPNQSFKRLNYFKQYSRDINKQIKTIQLLSYGIPVLKSGEEIGFYSDSPLDYNFKIGNIDLFNLYKTLLSFKKEHPSLQILDHATLRKEIVYTVKDNVVLYHIINKDDLYPHILVVHNFSDKKTITLPEGLKGFSHYNRHGEINWQVAFDSLGYYQLKTPFFYNDSLELQKNQSLILHFGLNKDNIIEEPIQVPEPPKENNIVIYLLISGGLIVVLGIVITYFILNPVKKDDL